MPVSNSRKREPSSSRVSRDRELFSRYRRNQRRPLPARAEAAKGALLFLREHQFQDTRTAAFRPRGAQLFEKVSGVSSSLRRAASQMSAAISVSSRAASW